MGLLDIFSDGNEKAAANTVDKGYKKGFRSAKKKLGKGYRDLEKNYADALKKIQDTAGRSRDFVTEGRDAGIDAVTGGRDAALSEFDPYVEATAGAPQLYSDALGLNGAEGNDRAVGAFQTGPGYDFRMDQGMQALQRLNASRGRLDSGNTMIDAMGFAGGLADQEYGSWLDRLSGQQEFGAGIAGSRAGIYGNSGAALAGLYTGAGSELGGITTGAGTKQAAIKTGLGDVGMGFGEKMADLSYATRLGRAGVEAGYLAGKDQSGMNAVGTVLGGASLGAKLLGAV